MNFLHRKKVVFFALFLLAAGAVWFFFFRSSEEGKVRAVLREFAYVCSRTEGEKTSLGLWKVHSSKSLFAAECVLSVTGADSFSGRYTPEALSSNLLRYRQMMATSEMSFSDMAPRIVSPERADVSFSARLRGVVRGGGAVDEVRDMECELVKEEGKWKIARLEARPVLER